ncbi:MAG TPA: DUF4058 family protein, partial [Pirellulales bacterium]|nr:DUF4058 family protein [Pirellulales bacterium]
MPIHDWTRVEAGIFHDFHQTWMPEIKRALNQGRLPPDYYALVEQVAGGHWSDILTLHEPPHDEPPKTEPHGGIVLAESPPQVQFRLKAEGDLYAAKASSVVIRLVSGHHIVAVLEVVSPGNKSSRGGLEQFVGKAVEMLRAGLHLLVVDLFPPGPRDPDGIHRAIWDALADNNFALPQEKRLTLAAYAAGAWPEAFVEPVAVGRDLPDMPLF